MEKVEQILREYAAGKKIALAVSGGADSMCLLDIVMKCPFIRREDAIVVHVRHGIRKEDGDDAALVKERCGKWGAAFKLFSGDVPALAQKSGLSVETEARNLRRRIFSSLIKEGEAQLVLTAHHRGDNAETVLMHLLRGCGLNGLRGMPVLSAEGLLRPLLDVSRKQIEQYNAQNGLDYVDDATNSDSGYTRNFLRLKVLPLLASRFDAEGALCSLARRAAADDDFINAMLDLGALRREKDSVSLPVSMLQGPEPLAARYALAMLKEMGCTDYGATAIDAVKKAATLGNGGKISVSEGLYAVKEYSAVTLFRPGIRDQRVYPYGEGSFEFTGFTASVRPCAPLPEKGSLTIDEGKIPAGAVLRTRREGDVFTPFGGGRRKLKEYLIDEKIPARLRDKLPLLCYNNTILAVFGREISLDVKLDEKSVRAVRLSLSYGE